MSNKRFPQSRVKMRAPKRKMKKRIKFFLVTLLIAFIAVASYGTHLYLKADSAMTGAYEEDERESGKSELRDEVVDPKFDNVSVLMMGIDQSEQREMSYGEKCSTDELVLVTLSSEDKSIKIISIMI